jgi:hypothetical protein
MSIPVLSFTKTNFENNKIIIPNITNFQPANDIFLLEQQFVSYLDRLLDQLVKNKAFSICLNNNMFERQRIQTNIPTILDNFIHVDLSTFTIKISQQSLNYISSFCTDKSLIVLPIKLSILNTQTNYSSTEQFSFDDVFNISIISQDIILSDFDETRTHLYHSNFIIIDNINNTIEYYEPHGISMEHISTTLVNLPNLLEKTLKIYLPFIQNHKLINASNTCILGLGAQSMQQLVNPNVGHCLAWSLYFITLRILNHSLTFKTTIENESISEFLNRFLITNHSSAELDDIIKRFISYVNLLPPTITTYSNNLQINIENYISQIEYANIRNRIKLLANIFVNKQYNKSIKNMDKLFEELISYRKFPDFYNIFNTEFSKISIDKMTQLS